MKGHIRRFVNEKNDIVTAEDMKVALESNGGVKGCHFIVAEVESTNPEGSGMIEGISLLNNFAYKDGKVHCWKAYNQGKGVTVQQSNYQFITGLKVKQPQSTQCSSKGNVSHKTGSATASLFFCKEPGCILTFKSIEDAELHMDTQKHTMQEETDTTYDRVQKQGLQKCQVCYNKGTASI